MQSSRPPLSRARSFSNGFRSAGRYVTPVPSQQPPPRPLPAARLPFIEAEIAIKIPANLRHLSSSLGFVPDADDIVEVYTQISLELLQTVLRSPDTRVLDDSDSEDTPDTDEEMEVVDLTDTPPPRPLKRPRLCVEIPDEALEMKQE